MLFNENRGDRIDTVGKCLELMAGITLKLRKSLETELKSGGLTYPQFGALFALQRHGAVSQKSLSEILETDTTTTMVICDSLERKGLIRRGADPSDRRVNRIEMTDGGEAALAGAMPVVGAVYGPILDLISDRDTALLLPVLERIFTAVRHRTADERKGEKE